MTTVAGDGTVLPDSTAYLLGLLEANSPHETAVLKKEPPSKDLSWHL